MVRGDGQVQSRAFVGKRSLQRHAMLVENVWDVLREDEPERDLPVLGDVHAGAQLVGGCPEVAPLV